ncbi:probable disease resistance protein At5g66900 isoform X2 [Vitis riparia]|uniref:probable disease resistance protein At5g66900 isoform X2 n=1 Tax=Vitis riparia TaxID=96939 RepID=UPI00155A184F|nr:probable disease resistance protein At5g66900 isoform X2 [Vitis riparia]
MALELVGGAALGAVFEKLFAAVVDASNKATQFESSLKKLEETLKSINPSILEMKKLNDQLDRPKEDMEKLIQILKDGEKLIHKCSKVSCCSYLTKWRYANKIEALEDSLLNFFQVELQAQLGRNNVEILVTLKSNRFSLSNRGVSDNFENLGSCEATDPPAFMVGLDVPLKELKRWLFTDGESRIVVSAPGGCGKTTLAKRLCHDQQVKEYFTDICYVTVSKTCDLIGIIKKLFWHNDEQVPSFQNEEDAVNQLERMLKKKVESGRILLVLDDVWSGSESVLAKFKKISGYKVLVTSRNEFPEFGSTYHLKLLSEEDAMTLFRHSAIPEDGSGSSMPSEDLVNTIVRCCKGFPLALEVVGRSLHGQPVEIWRSTLMKLSEGESIVNSEDELRNCLQSSLDALDDKDIMLKECFMDLGSFPEDQKIPATALIDMWAELHKVDKGGIYAISNLQKLCSRNLLNLVVTRNDANEIDWCYNDAFVMQHDLLRDLAIYQSNQEPIEKRKRLIVDLTGNRLPEWWTKEMQPRLSARLVSISTGYFVDEMFSSSWCNMQLPEAEVLILNFNQTEKKYELPEFMKQMDELKVLVVTSYGFCTAELTNFSVLGSLSNLKRIRLEQVSIPTLCNTSIELKNLEKLSLVMCHKIGQAFASSTIQIPEMLPKLREINIDYCNDLVELPEGFCDLVQLNKLSIGNCHKLSSLPEGIGKLTNLEVLRVSACTLVSKLPDSMGSLHKLRVLDITGCLRIRKMPKQIGELRSLREFHMRRCPGLCELPSSVTDLVDLKRVICDEETAQLWECYTHLLPDLTLSVPEEIINLNWL